MKRKKELDMGLKMSTWSCSTTITRQDGSIVAAAKLPPIATVVASTNSRLHAVVPREEESRGGGLEVGLVGGGPCVASL